MRARRRGSAVPVHASIIALGLVPALVAAIIILGLGPAVVVPRSAVAQSAPTASPPAGGVLAEVDGVPIAADEVTKSLGAPLTRLERQVYEMKRQRLDALIGERLIEREAARRGVSVSELVDREVTAKVAPVTDPEVEAFYEANKARINAPLSTLHERIRGYLQNQNVAAQRDAFVGTLRSRANVVVHLKPPPTTRVSISTEGAPTLGPANAPVTIVEFSDFYCPYCRQVIPVLAQVRARYGDKVRLVFKNLPLENLHPGATRAAEAAQCAKEQGKFWEFHDKLFAEPPDAAGEKFTAWADDLGLDTARFEQCLTAGRYRAVVQKDVDEALGLGANFTPAFFINGQLLSGAQPLQAFVTAIDEELKQPR
jgi:protein-disulfide isomerase